MRKPDQVPHPYPPGAQVRCIDDELSSRLKVGGIYTIVDVKGWAASLEGLPGTHSILRFEPLSGEASMARKSDAWECFCDASYYDMHCVRRVSWREFGRGFHLASEREAQELAKLLNEVAP